MPLLRKKPHKLLEPPKDLGPDELVYQVQLTKEIFREYDLYLRRINLYRKRIWTCKSTGKTSLTYEEALMSERHASEKVQALPKELVVSALGVIQFSMLSLKDLADTLASKLQTCFFVGAELCAKKGADMHPCKVLKILEEGAKDHQYEVGWFDQNKEIQERAVLSREALSWKKFPFSRNFLKSFIRESTSRSIPWVINENLAQQHGISSRIPEDLRRKYVFENGRVIHKRKRNKIEEQNGESAKGKGRKIENGSCNSEDIREGAYEPKKEPIKYPIEDLLVQPCPDDPDFSERPSPPRDFILPMDCVGDLIMVWNFCSSFGRQLHLSPFSLEDFENAVCHKESSLVLIKEVHACLFRFLIKDGDDYFSALKKRKRKSKITLSTWTEFLSDFLEVIDIPELCSHSEAIKQGGYWNLGPDIKLGILRELVKQAIETIMFKNEVDELIEEQHALGAARREEAIEEARKKREEKERSKAGVSANGHLSEPNDSEKKINGTQSVADSSDIKEIESTAGKTNRVRSSENNGFFEKSSHMEIVYQRKNKKVKIEENGVRVHEKDSTKEQMKLTKDGKRDTSERKGVQQRRVYYEREMEKRVVRTNPLGKDRHYNRYWWFRRDGRIFVESSDFKEWGYYSSRDELDALMGSLNCKGEREMALYKQLEKFYDRICTALQKRSKENAVKAELEEGGLRRSSRVRSAPRENPANSFLRYTNKWREE